MMKDYLFVDDSTGEEFLVEAESREEAETTAQDNFESPRLLDYLTVAEGECLGLDTY